MAGFWDWVKGLFGAATPDPAEPDAPAASAASSRPGRPATAAPASAPASAKPAVDPFAAAPGILTLSPEEFRARALKIRPHMTAFIGRVDLIPPQSDERTALIDRGLVLAGRLTEADLAEIHRVGDLWLVHRQHAQVAELRARGAGEAAVEALRAERVAKKTAKRAEAAERERVRLEAVARRRATDIVFLGRGVSGALSDRRANVERLDAAGLPVLSSAADLAGFLDVDIPALRWLAYHEAAARQVHYVSFTIPKRSGGVRTLSAPHRRLAAVQARILTGILEHVPMHPAAHGFVRGRSTVTNAKEHVGQAVVVNLDLRDFFPTITFPRVKGTFRRLGYSPAVATILALLCTESPRRAVRYDGERLLVATGARALPQGACTSPALSNLVAGRLDRRLAGYAQAAGWRYTRYADDLTFSGGPDRRTDAPRLLRRVGDIVVAEGFVVHPDKTRTSRRGGRQIVTGIIVNDRPTVPREEVRRLRAILHGARKHGLAAQNRERRPHFEAWLRGKLAYLAMVDPERGRAMLAELRALRG